MQHEQVKVNNCAFVRCFAKVVDHLLTLGDEHIADIFLEGLDGEDMAR